MTRMTGARTRLTAVARRLVAVVTALLVHRSAGHQTCPDCSVDFVPTLTDHRCPICGWRAVTSGRVREPRLRTRAATGLGLAWFVAAVVFALVAHALYT